MAREVLLTGAMFLRELVRDISVWVGYRSLLFAAVALASLASACEPCRDESTVTLSARLTPALGGDPMTASATYNEQGSQALVGPGLYLAAAIPDASAVSPGWAVIRLESTRLALSFTVPLPTSAGRVLPVVTAREALAPSSFTFVNGTDRIAAAFGADSVAAFSIAAPTPDCMRTTPDICAVEREADRLQTVQGSVQVISAKPLRLRLDLAISYPPSSGLAEKKVAGEVELQVTRRQECYPHT